MRCRGGRRILSHWRSIPFRRRLWPDTTPITLPARTSLPDKEESFENAVAPHSISIFLLHPWLDIVHSKLMGPLTNEEIRRAVQLALAEDIGSGDVTTLATVQENATVRAVMKARESLVPAGLP